MNVIAVHCKHYNRDKRSYFAFWIAFGLAEEDKILKEKYVSKSLLSTLPTIEFALS